MPSSWTAGRLAETEKQALACTSDDACTIDVVLLIGEVRRQHAEIADLEQRLEVAESVAQEALEDIAEAAGEAERLRVAARQAHGDEAAGTEERS